MDLNLILFGHNDQFLQRIPALKFLLLPDAYERVHNLARVNSPCIIVDYNKYSVDMRLRTYVYSFFYILVRIKS